MSQVVGESINVYLTLKVGVLGFQAAKRILDRGASYEDAAKAAIAVVAGWMSFVALSLVEVVVLVWIAVTPLLHYLAAPMDTGQQTVTDISHVHMWLVYGIAGTLTVYTIVVLWLVLYSRLKNLLASDKRGRLYRCGFRLDRRHFIMRRAAWVLGLWMMFAVTPYNALLNF